MTKTSDGILVKCSHQKIMPISGLQGNPRNPNKHGKSQIERLAKIIEYQGFTHPVLVSNLSGFIVAGHGRVQAAKSKGWSEVPVDFIDFENEDQEFAALVSDNSISEWSELDFASINDELGNLGPDFDLEMLGLEHFGMNPGELEDEDPFSEGGGSGKHLTCPACGVVAKSKEFKEVENA